jgi:hypothetical protein
MTVWIVKGTQDQCTYETNCIKHQFSDLNLEKNFPNFDTFNWIKWLHS